MHGYWLSNNPTWYLLIALSPTRRALIFSAGRCAADALATVLRAPSPVKRTMLRLASPSWCLPNRTKRIASKRCYIGWRMCAGRRCCPRIEQRRAGNTISTESADMVCGFCPPWILPLVRKVLHFSDNSVELLCPEIATFF